MNDRLHKKVVITGHKNGDKIITEKKVLEPRRRIEEIPIPGTAEEWDQYFEDHQYGFGADIKRSHGMDLATSARPHGPWFERLP
jgi:hypothetical protein